MRAEAEVFGNLVFGGEPVVGQVVGFQVQEDTIRLDPFGELEGGEGWGDLGGHDRGGMVLFSSIC